jgi:ferredoxin
VPNKLRIEIDRDLCIGSGECVRLAPQVYDIDDDGIAFVVDADAADEETLRTTARLCPSQAIRVVEPETT